MYLGDREHKYPHFHAFYGEYDGSFDLQTCELKAGELPKTVISKIRKWHKEHKTELEEIWKTRMPRKIK